MEQSLRQLPSLQAATGAPGNLTQNTANSALQPSATHTLLPSTPHECPCLQGFELRCL
jgi:hypothetical protein